MQDKAGDCFPVLFSFAGLLGSVIVCAKIVHNLTCSSHAGLMWRPLLAAVFVLAATQPGVSASDMLPDCVGAPSSTATIVRVINTYTVEIATGSNIKLAAIATPTISTTLKGRENTRLATRARQLLERLTLNKSVKLVFSSKGSDRYGRRVAHVFVPSRKKNMNLWVQGEMIKDGLARAFPNTPDATCIKQLLKFEKDARTKTAGLWNSRFYRIIPADDLKSLNRSLGRLQLVEGRVHSVSVRRNRSYINFSREWRQDFTATLKRPVHRLFTQSGINIEQLTGRYIRVRGWLDRHNGPTIEVYHVAQIEILKE